MSFDEVTEESGGSGRVVVLTVDRLGAGFLGPYGNTWIETPGTNRLASESLLFENFFIESDDPSAFFRSAMTGIHELQRGSQKKNAPAESDEVPALSNGRSILITDDMELADSDIADSFDEVLTLDRSDEELKRALEVEETLLGRLFAAAIQTIEDEPDASLIWIHSQSMDTAWDAPLEFRNQFAEEEDPDPPKLLEPPGLLLEKDYDPDEVTGISFAYAGQIVVLDYCLAALHDCIGRLPGNRQAMLLFAGTRGFPLGEHGAIGNLASGLHEELIHVPLLVRFPDGKHALARSPRIVQPCDLFNLIRTQLVPPEHFDEPNRFALLENELHTAIRTTRWHYVSAKNSDSSHQLYVKPDDRWEVNEIADRCREVCVALDELLQQSIVDANTA